MKVLKKDIVTTVGVKQVCGGLESGCEAAIHAIREEFEKPECEAAILVDATNAFNSLNRKAALQNINVRFPELSNFLTNTYQMPSNLHIADKVILSEEGTTQGDLTAMGFYAISTGPIITQLEDIKERIQVWFADDATAAGKIKALYEWWQNLIAIGPSRGYFPHPVKTVLIVKPQHLEEAKKIFKDTKVTITVEGKRHLGAVIGSPFFKETYVSELVKEWVLQLDELCNIAAIDPHAAYCAFTVGFC